MRSISRFCSTNGNPLHVINSDRQPVHPSPDRLRQFIDVVRSSRPASMHPAPLPQTPERHHARRLEDRDRLAMQSSPGQTSIDSDADDPGRTGCTCGCPPQLVERRGPIVFDRLQPRNQFARTSLRRSGPGSPPCPGSTDRSSPAQYSILSAILRIDTLSYPSFTNNARAASRISSRSPSFSRARLCLTPILNTVHFMPTPARCQQECALVVRTPRGNK